MREEKCVPLGMAGETGRNQWTKPRMNGTVQCVKTKTVAVIYIGTCQSVKATDTKDREIVAI